MSSSIGTKDSNLSIFQLSSKPITFYLIPCKQKRDLTRLITEHGGEMVQQRRDASYQLYIPGDIVSNPKQVSSAYISDSIKQGKLLDVEAYRYPVRSKVEQQEARHQAAAAPISLFIDDELEKASNRSTTSVTSTRTSRRDYSIDEDMAIICAVLKESKHVSINGNILWQTLASRKVTCRTSQSMKERFLKKILPYIERYDLSHTDLRKLKTITSQKTEKVANAMGLTTRRKALPISIFSSEAREEFIISSSSSSDEELPGASNVHRALRKCKPPIIELDSQESQQTRQQGKGMVVQSHSLSKQSPPRELATSPQNNGDKDKNILPAMDKSAVDVCKNNEAEKESRTIDQDKPQRTHVEEEPMDVRPVAELVNSQTVLHGGDVEQPDSHSASHGDSHSASHDTNAEQPKSCEANNILPDSNKVHSPQPGTPLTESDRQFKNLVMSDSMEWEGELWPCASPPITPVQPIVSAPNSKLSTVPTISTCPPPLALSTQNPSSVVQPPTDSQVSWSTFDWNSQKSNRLSSESAKSANGKKPRSPVTLPTTSKHVDAVSSGESDDEILSVADLKLRKPANVLQSLTTNNGMSPHIPKLNKPSTRLQHRRQVACEDNCDQDSDIVAPSWSGEDEMLSPTTPLQAQLNTASPSAPKTRSNLSKVLRDPLKPVQYEDANSTLSSQCSAAYVTCDIIQDDVADSSFKSTVSKIQHNSSTTSKVKAEPLSKELKVDDRPVEKIPTIEEEPDVEMCTECDYHQEQPHLDLCRINKLKSHKMYAKLQHTYQVEDSMLLSFVCGFSADWELLEQHFFSGFRVGRLWTQKHDRQLTNPNMRKSNIKELRRLFSTREIDSRKRFLLENVHLTPKEREVLLGMQHLN